MQTWMKDKQNKANLGIEIIELSKDFQALNVIPQSRCAGYPFHLIDQK